MVRVPAQNRENPLIENPPHALPARESQRDEVVNIDIPSTHYVEAIPSFFAQTINRDRVILFFCLNEDVSPCLCFQLSKPFVNNLEAIRIHAMPSKRINKTHPADAPPFFISHASETKTGGISVD